MGGMGGMEVFNGAEAVDVTSSKEQKGCNNMGLQPLSELEWIFPFKLQGSASLRMLDWIFPMEFLRISSKRTFCRISDGYFHWRE